MMFDAINSLSFPAALWTKYSKSIQSTTTIYYTLPEKSSSAKIIITDKNGKTLKELNVSGNGKGSIDVDAATFSSGIYQYSLIVDGKLMDTKQMILTKVEILKLSNPTPNIISSRQKIAAMKTKIYLCIAYFSVISFLLQTAMHRQTESFQILFHRPK
jgi:flagellar hook assembly protein FlgD